MIKVRLLGRMGNQMFQYAFAHLVSKKLNTKFILDTNWVPYDLWAFETAFPFRLLTNKLFFKAYNFAQKKIKLKHIIENMDCTEDISSMEFTDDSTYIGYFQEGGFYSEHKAELLKLFTVKKKYQQDFHQKYAATLARKKSVVISVRLGDYRKYGLREYNNASMLMPLDWYRNQLKKFETEDCVYFFISDELETVEKEIALPGKEVYYVKDTVVNQFQLLQHADVCIISNSTFPWWGAFLNVKAHSEVIAPKYFCGFNIGKEYPKGIQHVPFTWV